MFWFVWACTSESGYVGSANYKATRRMRNYSLRTITIRGRRVEAEAKAVGIPGVFDRHRQNAYEFIGFLSHLGCLNWVASTGRPPIHLVPTVRAYGRPFAHAANDPRERFARARTVCANSSCEWFANNSREWMVANGLRTARS